MSDKQMNYERILFIAKRVFGDKERAALWLKSKNPALGDKIPKDLLDTEEGYEQVKNVLERIEHGIIG